MKPQVFCKFAALSFCLFSLAMFLIKPDMFNRAFQLSASSISDAFEYTPRQADLGPSGFDIHHTSITTAEGLGARVIRFLSGTIVLITILTFMIGAGFWIFSAGNESLVERGKNMMVYSGIGVVVSLGAYVLVTIVQTALYTVGT